MLVLCLIFFFDLLSTESLTILHDPQNFFATRDFFFYYKFVDLMHTKQEVNDDEEDNDVY